MISSRYNRVLSILLIAVILGVIGVLVYMITSQNAEDRFTEFYVLGEEGEVGGYPRELVGGEEGKVRLGIINQEHDLVSYQTKIIIAGTLNSEIGPIDLAHGEKWEGEAGFIPRQARENQKVEFELHKTYKLGENEETSLSLWFGEEGLEATVVNQWQTKVSYKIEIEESIEGETRVESVGPKVLGPGEEWQYKLEYSAPEIGPQIVFSLYEDESLLAIGDFDNKPSQFNGSLIYKEKASGGYPLLHLWIDVKEVSITE
ncbi:MAG: DUF1616 domain-containing protein [Planctomycetes bacterium]|nr:DUF1616 domain-containing protein [Planctomycetota bacterium]